MSKRNKIRDQQPVQSNVQVVGSILGKLLDVVEEQKRLIADLQDLSNGWAQARRGAYYGESEEEAAREAGRISGKEYCAEELNDLLARYGIK